MKQANNTALTELIQQCRQEHSRLSKKIEDRTAVIVNTNSTLGVQYWTENQIYALQQLNTDKSISYFIERL